MRGKYIVIEGAGGVGKATMVQLVATQLQAAGLPVQIMREPDSQNDLTARYIQQLVKDPRYPMNTRTEVLLYNAARAQSLEIIRRATLNGVTCLVDRSYLTTLALQYYGRGDVPDYDKINNIIEFAVGDMHPDLMIVLDAPVAVLRARAKAHYSADRFDNLDESFQEHVRAGYLWEAKQRNLPIIYATDDQETVFKQVWKLVTETMAVRDHKETQPQSVAEVLAAKPIVKAAAVEPPAQTVGTAPEPDPKPVTDPPAPTNVSPPETTNNDPPALTNSEVMTLDKVVTNTEGSVYGFTDAISPTTIVATMTRLSRQNDDLRATILDEVAGKHEKDEQFLQQSISAHNNNSVQQLLGQYIVVENASSLLTEKLEWGRLASYFEPSTYSIDPDQKDVRGHYRYVVPSSLKGKIRSQYIRTMNQIFDTYSQVANKLTAHVRTNTPTPKADQDDAWRTATRAQARDAAQSLLPVAATSTVGIFASRQALESLILHLLSDQLPEATQVGADILAEARKTAPLYFEQTDKPGNGGGVAAYRANTYTNVKRIADALLPANHTAETAAVTLVNYSHHNELDIVADMLYEHSDLPLEALQQEVSSWPYQRKLDVFNAYMGQRLSAHHKPGRALEKIHYSWDIICDYAVFRNLQRHHMVDDMGRQLLSPRYGYETPKLVEDAGLSDDFDACFDLSLELFSAMQAAGLALEAQYATLRGHRMRWKVTYNAREAFHIHELHTSNQGHPGCRKLVLEMHEKLTEVHPLVAEAMKLVNQGTN